MSARNFLSAREKNISKYVDYLPNINQQKMFLRQELPVLSANRSNTHNRNLCYSSYPLHHNNFNSFERTGTPFSDFFSESETGTPDFRSEESDSSAGSVLRRNTDEATKILWEEWEKIERTLYDEDGEKTTKSAIIEECQQWRQLHPQLRIIGKAIPVSDKMSTYKHFDYDEVIAMHYSDYEEFSESEERLSQSSTDITPQNSPRPAISLDPWQIKLSREKISYKQYEAEPDLPNSFYSLLQITPLQIRSPSQRKRQNSSVVKSDLASSRWMSNSRPDSTNHFDRSSAKSYLSLDMRNHGSLVLSASERNKVLNDRVVTAKYKELARLQPLHTPELTHVDIHKLPNGNFYPYSVRKVSLPPLHLEEEKRKVLTVSPIKKHNVKVKRSTKPLYQLDRVKYL